MRKRKGFTLIELLVVIAIIGLLSTLAVVSLNSARQKSRDAKRVTDIKQIQTALELYHGDEEAYPTAASGANLGEGTNMCLDDANGFIGTCTGSVYMARVPHDPEPTAQHYVYTSAAGTTYSIAFSLEGKVGDLEGDCVAAPGGDISCS